MPAHEQNIFQPNSTAQPPARTSRRIVALLVLGGAFVGGGLFYFHFWIGRPVGQGPAGPAVPHELFNQTWTSRPVLVLGLGDSVSAGFGARKNYSYFDRLVTNPADEDQDLRGICLRTVLPNLQVTNLALSGSTSIQHLQKQLGRLGPLSSNVLGLVVVTTGGNDIIHDYGRTPPREGAMYGATLAQAKPWIANFEQRLETILARLAASFPGGCQIFLANIYDPTDGFGDAERAGLPAWKEGTAILRAYNEVISRCAAKHDDVHLVNLHDAFLGHGIHCAQFWSKHYHSADPHYWYHENLEDPNERGYDAIRRLFLIEMAKVASQFR